MRTRGADETIDRRIAEQLIEPCLQLVRNAVAHGIEPPEARVALGKPPSGTIALAARKVGNRLSLTIEDDGAGVDVADVRARAVGRRARHAARSPRRPTTTRSSRCSSCPGFSTRESSDLLAGRGIGLDIARSGVQRMGGAIRLSSRAGEGFSARIDVPIDSGLVTVLWVRRGQGGVRAARGERAPRAPERRRRRRPPPASAVVPRRHACRSDRASRSTSSSRATPTRRSPASVGVDAVGQAEELLVRPLGPLVAGLGPFAGAIVRGDGSLRLAIDAWAIAPRARAFTRRPGRAHDGRAVLVELAAGTSSSTARG